MASTAEGGNPGHKMKRTAKPFYRRSHVGVASAPSVGDRMRSQTGDVGDVPFPKITSDIIPPAESYQSAPPIETPVPLPVHMRTPTLMTSTPGSTAKQRPLAANKDILQAQRDWEKRQTLMEDQGPTQEGRTSVPMPRPQIHVDLTKASTQREPTEISEASPQRQLASETGAMAGLKRLPEDDLLQQMTELNRPASAGSRRRQSRTLIVPEPPSEAASRAFIVAESRSPPASPSIEPLPSDPGDAMDTEDGDSTRTGLQTNADNVSYYTYIEDDGSEQSTSNVPLPPGKERYENGENGGKLPFVCPVRDCRVLSVTMRALSSHFHGKHNRTLFNDNGDGTFSKVGDYVNEDSSSPGIIVSRNPLSPGAPPPAAAEYSSQKRLLSKKSPLMPRGSAAGSAPPDTSKRPLRGDASSDTMEENMPKRPKTTPVPLPVQVASLSSSPSLARPIPPSPPPHPAPPIQSLEPPMTDVLRYLHRSLSLSQQVPARPDVLALSKYERVRRLPGLWLEHHHDKTLDPLQYACTLAYLVGKAEELNSCGKWKGLSRLSEPCVGLPPDLPPEARAAFSKTETCIACQYQFCCYRTKNECEWANKDHDQSLEGTVEEAVQQQDHQPTVEEGDKDVVLDDEDMGGGAAAKVDDHAAPPRVTSQSGSFFSSTKQSEQHPIQSSEKKSHPLATTTLPLPTPITVQKVSSAEVAEMEEMEDWEVAPGTMKDETTNTNIGFSNAYMSNQHPITISPGIRFNVLILKPGHTHHWPTEANKVRTCSVATGKISVKMGNDQSFKLGPNGLVVIRPGHSCMVANRLYSDAVLHCTTLEDDF